MRSAAAFVLSATVLLAAARAESTASHEEQTLRRIFNEALVHGEAYDNLRTLVTDTPGRFAGSQNLERAIVWAEQTLGKLQLDRVAKQDVMVPHWERGAKETVTLLAGGSATPLSAVALGNSGATSDAGLTAEVLEVKALDELATLGREKIAGRIIFFNRPMDPTLVSTGFAYGRAGDQRNLAVETCHALLLPRSRELGVPSPFGRRWREATDEGSGPRQTLRSDRTLTPTPLPQGEGLFESISAYLRPGRYMR